MGSKNRSPYGSLGLLKLADKYTPERLESACRRAFEYTPQTSCKNIQTILATGQDEIPDEPEPPSSSQYGFTCGAEYYSRREKIERPIPHELSIFNGVRKYNRKDSRSCPF